jgi:hypothetical protein
MPARDSLLPVPEKKLQPREPEPGQQTAFRRRILRDGAVVAGLIFGLYLVLVAAPAKGSLAFDAVAYWQVNLARPYGGNVGDLGFFAYAPPIALLAAPLGALPWQVFIVGWYGLLLGATLWLGRRRWLLLLAFPPVAVELYHANIHLLMACAIVLGFRYPAAWAFVLLTKVTPGIALLWFVARRERRQLFLAIGATGAIVGVTVVTMPTQWQEWLGLLAASSGSMPPWPALPIPLWLRLPAAAALVWWGARRDAYWTVPAAAAIALPALWPGGLAILAAWWRLPASSARYDLRDALRALSRRTARIDHPARV